MFIASFRLKTSVQKILCSLREIVDYPLMHPGRELALLALRESTEYAKEHMTDALPVETARQALDLAVKKVEVKGHFMEFGVYKGGTLRYIARQLPPGAVIHGFDSFEGLKTDWTGNTSRFDARGKLPKVPASAILHRGYFSESLPDWLKSHDGPVAFIHIDCDIYASTKDIFEALAGRIVAGTVIVFDEYFNYPGWQRHEFRAFQEFVAAHRVKYEYVAFARIQVVVKVLEIATP